MFRYIVIVGGTATGKTVLESKFEQKGYSRVISTTTRLKRVSDGPNAYHFITDEEFDKKIKDNEMVEYVEYNGKRYGVAKKDLPLTGKVVMVLEPQGFYRVDKLFPGEVLGIYLKVTLEEQIRRCKLRGESEEFIRQRERNDRTVYPEHLMGSCVEEWVNKSFDQINEGVERIVSRNK